MSLLKGLFGPPNVEQLRAKGNIDGLIKALSYQRDAGVRQAAAVALGQSGDPRAVEPLIAALGDSNHWVRQAVVEALGMIGDARAGEPLSSLREDADQSIRAATTRALSQIDASPAAEHGAGA